MSCPVCDKFPDPDNPNKKLGFYMTLKILGEALKGDADIEDNDKYIFFLMMSLRRKSAHHYDEAIATLP